MGRALGGDQVQSRMKSVSAPRRKLTVAGVQLHVKCQGVLGSLGGSKASDDGPQVRDVISCETEGVSTLSPLLGGCRVAGCAQTRSREHPSEARRGIEPPLYYRQRNSRHSRELTEDEGTGGLHIRRGFTVPATLIPRHSPC